MWKGFFTLKCVITAATINTIIPVAPNKVTFESLLKNINAKDNFIMPTKSLSQAGRPYALNSPIISRYLTTQTKKMEPAAKALSA